MRREIARISMVEAQATLKDGDSYMIEPVYNKTGQFYSEKVFTDVYTDIMIETASVYVVGVRNWSWNPDCKVILFTEETNAEEAARLSAMPPMQRLAHELYQAKARPEADTDKILHTLDPMPTSFQRLSDMGRAQVAAILVTDTTLRTQFHSRLAEFDALINDARSWLKSLETPPKTNAKIASTIKEQL